MPCMECGCYNTPEDYEEVCEELRETKHSLWIARATWNHRVVLMAKRDLAKCEKNSPMYSVCKLILNKWKWAERMCRKKAKECR